ncbi:hypothetical protein ACTXM3_05125 [Glutamicibacter arilaitensis]|uniref:hypothetical protein n=1 Tax=Glutamicibacter TaxID=1742989 RepID=UPI00059F9804|nr:hypothetical protein [Glutamicibacter sp.]HCH48815.1 hypothetical protein [Glutamicibacter sp.]HCM95886.1 hypothetical protein [Glutamicibacter sp.]
MGRGNAIQTGCSAPMNGGTKSLAWPGEQRGSLSIGAGEVPILQTRINNPLKHQQLVQFIAPLCGKKNLR